MSDLKKRILLTGGTGFIGSHLRVVLAESGHEVLLLSRQRRPGAYYWSPDGNEIDESAVRDVDAVVHLAGENIAGRRWSAKVKGEIAQSRIAGTSLLVRAIQRRERPLPVFISASAVGFYGSRGTELLDETSGPGAGFLSEVCRGWEAAAAPLTAAGTRVVSLRFGAVLDPRGGALARMLPPFRLGLGGAIGSGAQSMSWVTLHDATRAIVHCLGHSSLSGPINVTSPNPVTNLEFTRRLGWALRRPTFFTLPSFVARAILGEMADDLLLSSLRVYPAKLLADGFQFEHPTLESALASFAL